MKKWRKNVSYVFKLYLKIFKELGIKVVPVRAPAGEIGETFHMSFI